MLRWGKKQGSAIDGVPGFELSLIITYLPVVSLNEEDASPGFPLFPLVKIVSRSSKCRQNLANTRKENSFYRKVWSFSGTYAQDGIQHH